MNNTIDINENNIEKKDNFDQHEDLVPVSQEEGSLLPVVSSSDVEPVSPLKRYLMEISRYPLLSSEEEYQLAVSSFEKQDPIAIQTLITSNLRLVVKIANDFKQTRLNILDLIQEGNVGLMQAVKKFNPYKGVKLSSYAAWWIKAYILKYIMDNKSQIRIGTTAAQRKLFYNLEKETQKLLGDNSSLDVKYLAQNLDVKESEVIEMQQRMNSSEISLETASSSDSDDDRRPIISTLQDNTTPIDELLSNKEIMSIFKDHLKEFEGFLSTREAEIFHDRLLTDNPLTLQQIANKYQITRERVRQIEARVIKNLKEFVKQQGLIDVDTDSVQPSDQNPI